MALKFQPRPYQIAGHEALRENFRKGMRRQVLVMPTGAGKCLARGTEVLMFDGRRMKVEDVIVGDLLMGPDSRPRTVLSTAEGHGPLRRVVPLRGEPWVCNDAHILTLVHTETGEVVDVSIDEWRSWSKWRRHVFKQFSVGVDFQNPSDLPIDPYFLGVWFGDGTKKVGDRGLKTIVVNKPDEEIVESLREVASQWACTVTTGVYGEDACPAHYLTTPKGQRNPLLEEMRRMLGFDLIVPHAYLVASRSDRLAFLAGWVDTDGHISNGCIDFVQKRRDYADAVCFLARSLGFRVAVAEKKVGGESYWRLSIAGDASKIPMRIARKRGVRRTINKDVTRTGFSIDDMPDGAWHGFTIDGDGRFLLGSFVVTHNTGLAAMIIEATLAKGNEVLFLAHRKELIDQCSKTLDFFGVDHGVIKAKHWRDRPSAPVQVASVQTLIRRQQRPKARVVILDEAHRSLNETNKTILSWYPDALSLGLTATPERLDGRGLDEMYEEMVQPITMTQAVAHGYLLPCQVFDPGDNFDLRGLRRVGGDYSNDQLAERAKENPRRVGSLVENWRELAYDRQTIVFAINRDDSRAIAARYNEAKIPAEHLDGDMSDGTREAILNRFANGETKVVTNCDVLVEGYDLPSVGCVQLARPTLSVSRFLQMIGRGSRPVEGMQNFVVLDHAGCCDRIGDPIQDWPWSLQGRRGRKDLEDLAEIKMITCETCSLMRRANIEACPKCKPNPIAVQVPMFDIPVLPAEVEGKLVERTAARSASSPLRDDVRRCRKCGSSHLSSSRQSDLKILWRCTSCKSTEFAVDTDAASRATDARKFQEYLQLERIRVHKGRQPSWSAHLYKSVFGTFPPREWRGKVDAILSQERKT